MEIVGPVLIDGAAIEASQATVPVADLGFLRGYGVFELMRSYDGSIFRLGPHLDRLEASAAMTGIPLPERASLEKWCTDRAREGDVVVRLIVTAGTDPENLGADGHAIVMAQTFDGPPSSVSLTVRPAPWHADGAITELGGAKTLSYGPNVAAIRAAKLRGFDAPVLIGRSGRVLEGPTCAIGWVIDGVVETPGLETGILCSITRDAMLEVAAAAAIVTREGDYPVERLLAADEVFIMSTATDITPVDRIDDISFVTGEVTRRLAEGFTRLVAAEAG